MRKHTGIPELEEVDEAGVEVVDILSSLSIIPHSIYLSLSFFLFSSLFSHSLSSVLYPQYV